MPQGGAPDAGHAPALPRFYRPLAEVVVSSSPPPPVDWGRSRCGMEDAKGPHDQARELWVVDATIALLRTGKHSRA
ncbi:hypothetical protein NDU88_003920 [Pleurodeles waltl]|uniref:Uncharacterized protein n=1 Tax=Pleurodeles waltl TaxID=8319 RepID=A0AAV7T6H2_PLEWA|nr:hypothetical protein NDU88_003920 [Pleurodeles waltl]